MVKTTINDQWKQYIYKQIERGVNKKQLQDILEKQNYSSDIINKILNSNETVKPKIELENSAVTSTELYNDPVIYTINDFLSLEECKHIIYTAKDRMKRALVSSDNGGVESSGRTGENCWIKLDHDDIFKGIANRMAKQIGMSLDNAEPFQVIHYKESQTYRPHFDSWLHDNSEKSKRTMMKAGQRLWTVLGYLNVVEMGGETRFTKLNIDVKPSPGRILVFSNVYQNTAQRHPLSEHTGSPVIKGEKWAFNLWFREQPRDKVYEYSLSRNTIVDKKDIV